jgi:hypothetical protein
VILKHSRKRQNLGISFINSIAAIPNSVMYVEARISSAIAIANINAQITVLIPNADIQAHIHGSIRIADIKARILVLIPVADIQAHIFLLTPIAGINVGIWYMIFRVSWLELRCAHWNLGEKIWELRTGVG